MEVLGPSTSPDHLSPCPFLRPVTSVAASLHHGDTGRRRHHNATEIAGRLCRRCIMFHCFNGCRAVARQKKGARTQLHQSEEVSQRLISIMGPAAAGDTHTSDRQMNGNQLAPSCSRGCRPAPADANSPTDPQMCTALPLKTFFCAFAFSDYMVRSFFGGSYYPSVKKGYGDQKQYWLLHVITERERSTRQVSRIVRR